MKKFVCALAVLSVALLMTGCFSVNTNDKSACADIRIEPQVLKTSVTVQEKKVSGEASVNALFGIFVWGATEYADGAFFCCNSNSLQLFVPAATVAKQGATYDACNKAKADYILGAKYKVDTKDYFVFKQIKCTVTGFPAEIKAIK